MGTKIQWTDETWNPVVGCTKVSTGCQNCYAERMANRFDRTHDRVGNLRPYYCQQGYNYNWKGLVACRPDVLDKPLHWKKPRMIFVCSMGDLFHESVPFEFIDNVFNIIELCRQHTFQILTKRPEILLKWSKASCAKRYLKICKNLWLGVTAENQEWWNKRKDAFLSIPAAVHFVSNEPLLGEIRYTDDELRQLGQVIVGGESGPKARPMHPDWVRKVRDDCVAAGVPFFFKQWGGINKKKAGRLLDGREWNELPKETR